MPKSELLDKSGDPENFAGNPQAISEAAQAVREMAENRASLATQKGNQVMPGMHLIPMEGDTQAAYDSAAWLAKRQKEEEEIRVRKETEDLGKYRYYLKCRNPRHVVGETPAPPHGVYFTKNPHGDAVLDHDWFATYKTKEDLWRQEIVCQVCLKMGVENATLPVEWVNPRKPSEGWRPEQRWIWKSPIDVKRWEIEGDTRANDLPTQASNMWRDEVKKKLVAAGLEKE